MDKLPLQTSPSQYATVELLNRDDIDILIYLSTPFKDKTNIEMQDFGIRSKSSEYDPTMYTINLEPKKKKESRQCTQIRSFKDLINFFTQKN